MIIQLKPGALLVISDKFSLYALTGRFFERLCPFYQVLSVYLK
jgi:hypothetical protein